MLGTVDQLLIDVCIIEEVRSYHRNLAVAYYDYKKAYDKVHHDWMLIVFNWMGIPKNVTTLLKALMVKWKTRLEVWNDGQKQVSRWIQIMCGFLQGDSGILPYRGSSWQITQSVERLQNGKARKKKYKAYTQSIYRRPQDIPGEPQDVTNSK